MKFEEAWNRASSIASTVTKAEGRALWECAIRAWTIRAPIVEIGAYHGRTTALLADSRGELVTVDPFDKRTGIGGTHFTSHDGVIWERNRRRLGLDAQLMQMESLQAAVAWVHEERSTPGLVFIDGDHRHEAVSADFREWAKLLHPQGLIALHDVHMDGPGRVLEAALADGWVLDSWYPVVDKLAVLARA